MPSTSKAQQRLMGMAYAYKKGELQSDEVSPDIIQLANSMNLKQLKDFASTKHNDLRSKADENIGLGNLGGMGANFLPTGTEVGSGDILSGTGSAEEEYKKKKKKRERAMKTKKFEEFVNEKNAAINEASKASAALMQFAKDEKSEGSGGEIHLADFDGSSFNAQSTNKTWDDGVPVTKNFTRGGYKSTSPKGQIWIIESENWWYFQNKGTWFAVSRKEYGRPPFDY